MSMPETNSQGAREVCLSLSQAGDTAAQNNAALLAYAAGLWAAFADKDQVYPRLRFWYTRRACCDALLSGQVQRVDFGDGDVKQSNSQISENLHTIRADCQAEIARLESYARASQQPVAGAMTATQPGGPPPFPFPNPAGRRVRGLPRVGPWWDENCP